MNKHTIAETYTAFKRYYGFDANLPWIKQAEPIKSAIGKTLKEFLGDAQMTRLSDKGYDHVIINNTVVGLYDQPKILLNTEILVLPETISKIHITDNDSGVYHYSPQPDIQSFDDKHMGECHGLSYGAGLYLTDTAIPSYGVRYCLDISNLHHPYILNLHDDTFIIDYLCTCILN